MGSVGDAGSRGGGTVKCRPAEQTDRLSSPVTGPRSQPLRPEPLWGSCLAAASQLSARSPTYCANMRSDLCHWECCNRLPARRPASLSRRRAGAFEERVLQLRQAQTPPRNGFAGPLTEGRALTVPERCATSKATSRGGRCSGCCSPSQLWAAWGLWAVRARVPGYEVTVGFARLDVASRPHPVVPRITGRVARDASSPSVSRSAKDRFWSSSTPRRRD